MSVKKVGANERLLNLIQKKFPPGKELPGVSAKAYYKAKDKGMDLTKIKELTKKTELWESEN